MTPEERIDEILDNLCQYVHGVASASRHYGIFIGGEPLKEAKASLLQMQRCKERRLTHGTDSPQRPSDGTRTGA